MVAPWGHPVDVQHAADRPDPVALPDQAAASATAAAAFLERSMMLTAEPGRRAERTLAAAQASIQAGAFDQALGLLAGAETGPLDEFSSAR